MVRKRQRGMTMWGTAFVVAVAAFALFLLFKLLPPYIEDFKVRTALEGITREPNAGTMSRAEIIELLNKRFEIDDVTRVRPAQDLHVQVQGRNKIIRIRYEVVVPLAYNVSALLEFDHVRQVRGTE